MNHYNPEQAASMVGTSASTIRNWCKTFAALLGEGANPTTGFERRLTQADVATLQRVKALRDNRMTTAEIVATLQQVAATPPLTIDVAPTPTQTPTEGHSEALLLPVVLDTLTGRQNATDARLDALQQALATLQQQQTERVNMLVTGIVIGGAAVLVVVAVVIALAQ